MHAMHFRLCQGGAGAQALHVMGSSCSRLATAHIQPLHETNPKRPQAMPPLHCSGLLQTRWGTSSAGQTPLRRRPAGRPMLSCGWRQTRWRRSCNKTQQRCWIRQGIEQVSVCIEKV